MSTSTTEQLDEFWDDVTAATRREGHFRPVGRLVTALNDVTPHVLAGDFNAQLYEPDAELTSNIVGRFRPPFRHMLDEYAYMIKLLLPMIGSWRTALGRLVATDIAVHGTPVSTGSITNWIGC